MSANRHFEADDKSDKVADDTEKQPTQIITVGAGISGLAAAAQLQKHGIADYKILEASDRIGGRIHTLEVGNTEKHIFELGAQWIHGQKKNPVFELAKEHGLVESKIKKKKLKSIYVTEEGEHVDKKRVDRILGKIYQVLDDAEEFCTTESDYPDLNENIEDYLQQHFDEFLSKQDPVDRLEIECILHHTKLDLCAYCGCDSVSELSLKEHGRYEELKGEDVTISKGYNSVIDIIKGQIPSEKILFNRSVKTIEWQRELIGDNSQIKIRCENGETLHAQHVILTVSLGILKAKSKTLFSPNLPQKKQDAIEKLGFGIADKVILIFKEQILGKKIGCLNFLWNPNSDDKDGDNNIHVAAWCKKMYDVSVINGNAIFGWLTGMEALEMESLTDEQVIQDMLQVLKIFLKRDDIPRPVRLIRTRWGTNPTTLGSYSFARVGSSVQDILDLQEPVLDEQSNRPILLFAGEATHERFYSSVHGAMLSGHREAQRLIEIYNSEKTDKKEEKPEKRQKPDKMEKEGKKGKPSPTSGNAMLSGQREAQRLIDLYKDEESIGIENPIVNDKLSKTGKSEKKEKVNKKVKQGKSSTQNGASAENQQSTTYKLKLFNSM